MVSNPVFPTNKKLARKCWLFLLGAVRACTHERTRKKPRRAKRVSFLFRPLHKGGPKAILAFFEFKAANSDYRQAGNSGNYVFDILPKS
jgi:hypothetical protein